jgi:hypothetical protein
MENITESAKKRPELTLEESLTQVRKTGYVRINDGFSATTEEQVKEIFASRIDAWKKAGIKSFGQAIAEANAANNPLGSEAMLKVAQLEKDNAELRASIAEIKTMLTQTPAPAPAAAPTKSP